MLTLLETPDGSVTGAGDPAGFREQSNHCI